MGTNKHQVQLHRLDSYQASQNSGSAGNPGERKDDVTERQERNDHSVDSQQIHVQLSLTGSNDAYYDEIMDNVGNTNQHSFSLVDTKNKYCHCFWRVLGEKTITFLPILVLIILAMFSHNLLHRKERNVSAQNTHDTKEENGFSPSPSNLTCPIQSSYYVFSEVMRLKNFSTGKSTTCSFCPSRYIQCVL